ncbi:type II/IV secretion system protein [Candidatus Saccharibacteria bacterium]|nr:type II/IV secretion system protein [Candidatus Saccharibacteria bacterium]
MKISDALVEKLVLDSKKATKEQLNSLREEGKAGKKSLQEVIIANNILSEKDLTKLYAKEADVPYVDLNPKEIKREVLRLIPERIARQYNVVVFDVDNNGNKLLAVEDPDDIQAISFLQKQLGANLKVHVATGSSIQTAIDQYKGNISSELTKVISDEEEEDAKKSKAKDEEVSEEDLAEDSPIAQTVNLLIEYAIKAGASDIHIEPRENYVLVRYRVDGVLREANKLPKKVIGALISRIKILANLKIDEHRAPQDGRFKIQVSGQVYALRVSTLPIMDGEKVVMRILDESSKALTLEELGFWGISLETINRAIVQPYGMLLVTGPTGSGKSTTLFSVLNRLSSPNVNISTVEDPVEYRIQGANQTQVNPVAGMTFVNGLRALLRQDPNIIMVGEVRDGETANLAVQAALTGHLVFSTLHTNNAATCLPRLLDMNVEAFLIASTVRAVVGQRLIRRLCLDCRESYQPDATITKKLQTIFHIDDSDTMKHIHELEKQALEAGIGKSNSSKKTSQDTSQLSSTETKITTLWRAHDGGCETCNHSGYKGRMGIYEVLENTSPVQSLIVGNATSEKIQDQAIKDGMVTMQTDGFIKSLRGQTSIEEILRVTSET